MSISRRIKTMEKRHRGVLSPESAVIIYFKDGRLFDTETNRFTTKAEIEKHNYQAIAWICDNGRQEYK